MIKMVNNNNRNIHFLYSDRLVCGCYYQKTLGEMEYHEKRLFFFHIGISYGFQPIARKGMNALDGWGMHNYLQRRACIIWIRTTSLRILRTIW